MSAFHKLGAAPPPPKDCETISGGNTKKLTKNNMNLNKFFNSAI
jgi:hypothetical protein